MSDKKQGCLAGWARQCYDQNRTLDQIVDPILKGKIAPQCLKKFCEVAMSCLDDEGIKRLSMSDVVWGLEFALRLQQDRIGGHVLESRTMSTMTISSSDDYGFSSKDSDSIPVLV
ncbi:hypothetical protein QYF36_013459 [Acer negundo]|nr:hypothetical protein QYF36_013459 [Acer negundo]